MLSKLLIAWILMAACVTIHAIGLVMVARRLQLRSHRSRGSFWQTIWLLVNVAGWVILIHLVEIGIWAAFYTIGNAMPDLPSSFYFSMVTYTTTGYGDLVLPQEWRLVGGVEALTGILMCGLSTGLFFAVLSKLLGHRLKLSSD